MLTVIGNCAIDLDNIKAISGESCTVLLKSGEVVRMSKSDVAILLKKISESQQPQRSALYEVISQVRVPLDRAQVFVKEA